jgi:uncharacterized membrane protein (DUF485 family)
MYPDFKYARNEPCIRLDARARISLHENSEGTMDVSSHEKIEQDPNFQELVRRRSSLGWTLALIMLIIYFGFILLVAYAPKFLGIPMGTGVTTIGIPIGLLVIVSAFLLTGIYVRKATSQYDPLIRKIVGANRS